ncbi:MAG: response regulator [Pseudomonadota bacterium]
MALDDPNSPNEGDLADIMGQNIAFLRRYGRALTGSQTTGDAYAAATIEALVADPTTFDVELPAKVALFKIFHTIWQSSGAPTDPPIDGVSTKPYEHLEKLTPNSREALLLYTLEELPVENVGDVLGLSEVDAGALIKAAFSEMEEAIKGQVMIIEDEAIIAVDLEAMIREVGHNVTGIAVTRENAVELGKEHKPDLILADIQLADGSSGIDAVNELLPVVGNVPVIFVTAFPERLLTGATDEPAFMITKPYKAAQVRAAISQAMFFASTEPLRG